MNELEALRHRVAELEEHEAETKKLLRFGSGKRRRFRSTLAVRLTPEQVKKAVDSAIRRLSDAGFAYQKPAKHTKSGEVYEVLGLVLDERTKAAHVVYQGADEINWSRPLYDFLKKFERVGPW